jgi:hypothetical protein
MPWVRLDDRMPSHRKVALLSDRAFRLYISALCWSSENLTEGRILAKELPLVAGRIRGPKTAAAELETAGLWDPADGDGWQIHDFLEYNPDRAKVKAEREANAARQKAFRERKRAERNGDRNAPRNGVTPDAEKHDDDTTSARRAHDDDTTTTRTDLDPEASPQVNEIRNGVTNGTPSRPQPLSTPYGSTDTLSPASSETESDALPAAEKFGAFWIVYPKKRGKEAARTAWAKAIKRGADPAHIVQAATAYAQERAQQDARFTKHPSTWLNAGCYDDEPEQPRPHLRAVSGDWQPYKQPTPDAYANDLGF